MQILAGVGAGVPTYTYHVFTSSGTLTVTQNGTMSLIAVGGGAGGGGSFGGGGGAAELDNASYAVGVSVTGNQTITIGANGVGSNFNDGTQGGTTTIGSLVSALGGGSGRGQGGGGNPDGGSGGGGCVLINSGIAGTASGTNTFAGGSASGSSPNRTAGGGGGASEVGDAGSPGTPGNGGEGLTAISIDANLTAANFPTTLTNKGTWSSGGGGSAQGGNTPGTGGTGAGNGVAGIVDVAGSATMYGAGGGGCGGGNTTSIGGDGFAGIVIVRYLTGTAAASGGQETAVIPV